MTTGIGVSGSSVRPPNGAQPLGILAIFVALAAAALLAFAPTLSVPFFGDDIDVIHRTAAYRAGELTLYDYLAQNHNEHRMPVMRAVALAATLPGNLDARALHLAVFLVHAGCATLVALMVLPVLGTFYAMIAGAVFAVSGVFCSTVVWAPTCAVFSLSLFFILLARHAIDSPVRPRIALASVALLLAALSLNGSVVAVIPFAVAFWEKLGATRTRRAAVVAAWIIGAALVFRWSSANFVAPLGGDAGAQLWPAIRNGAFLVLSASTRWIRAWTAAVPGATPTPVALVTSSAIVALGVLILPNGLRKQVLVLLASAVLIALAVGYGRRDQPLWMLYLTDRYYYAFAAPFAAVSAAAGALGLERFYRRWLAPAVLAGVVAAGAMFTRNEVRPFVTADHIQAHRAAMVQGRSLATLLREEAAVRPLRISDGFIPLPGVQKNGMTLGAIVRGVYPRPIDGLQFVQAGGPTDDERLNAVLTAWARRAGWPHSPVLAAHGTLKTVVDADVDFRKGPFDSQVGPGFHAWEFVSRSRWLSRRGSVKLPYSGQKSVVIEARVLGQALRGAGILKPSDHVAVSANGTPIGTFDFQSGDQVTRGITLPASRADSVEIALESSFAWYARQVYPDNLDPRELSISVIAIRLTD